MALILKSKFGKSMALAVTMALVTAPAGAQSLHDYGASPGGSAITGRGVAVRASVRIALGASNPRQSTERVTLNIATGPSYRIGSERPGVNGRVVNGDAVRLSLGLDHSRTVRLNGVQLTQLSGPLNADEGGSEGEEDKEEEGKSRRTPTWALVGLGALAGVGALFVYGAIAFAADDDL